MTKSFWAKRKKLILGPFPTRESALAAFRETYPVKGPEYTANAKKNDIMTGYGRDGPFFDIRWDKARDLQS